MNFESTRDKLILARLGTGNPWSLPWVLSKFMEISTSTTNDVREGLSVVGTIMIVPTTLRQQDFYGRTVLSNVIGC